MGKEHVAVDKDLQYLTQSLKAPRIAQSYARIAEQARTSGWTHEEYLAAVLEQEVVARNASGARNRIRAAGIGASKTLDEFDWAMQPAERDQILGLAGGAYLHEGRNIVLLGPPGTRKTHLCQIGSLGSDIPATYEVVRSVVHEAMRFSVHDVARLHTRSSERHYPVTLFGSIWPSP